jgi:hypothetical protein
MSLIDALSEVEKKPLLWLNENNISCLRSFLNGWIVGRNEEEDEKLMSDFDRFVVDEFNEGNSTCGWCGIIVKHCGEADTLSSFFELFNKFKESY